MLQDFSFTFTGGEVFRGAISGNLIAYDSGTDPIEVKPLETGTDRDFITLLPGASIRLPDGQQFTQVAVKSATAQAITVKAGSIGEYTPSTQNTYNISATLEPATTVNPLPAITIGAGATVALASGDANRRELRVSVPSSAGNGIWLGDATAAVNVGAYVEEGMSEYLSTTAAIYAHNPGAASVTVNLLSMERP